MVIWKHIVAWPRCILPTWAPPLARDKANICVATGHISALVLSDFLYVWHLFAHLFRESDRCPCPDGPHQAYCFAWIKTNRETAKRERHCEPLISALFTCPLHSIWYHFRTECSPWEAPELSLAMWGHQSLARVDRVDFKQLKLHCRYQL